MNNVHWKRLILAVLLVALLLMATGCFVKPDPTVEDNDTNPVSVLPFPTATEIPTLPPNGAGQSGWEDWATNPPANIVTQAPSSAPTIQVITSAPTPIQAYPVTPVSTPVTITPPPTIPPTPRATSQSTALKEGAEGQKVRELQQRLKELGYYTGSVDGSFGPATDTALKAFQKANGLSADGIAGSRTLTALNSKDAKAKPKSSTSTSSSGSKYATSRPTPKTYTPSTLSPNRKYLQLGSSGSDVTNLQRRLKQLGYYSGTVNGRFDEATEAAVRVFQKRNGLYEDGVAGEDTQNELYKNSALPYGGAVQPTSQIEIAVRTLKNGMNGEDVQLLQARLQDLYYYNNAVTGRFDASTEQAVKAFQQQNGLISDGVAGASTQDKLYATNALAAPMSIPSPTAFKATTDILQTGSTGADVYRLQERLFDLGYYTGLIDGIYNESVTAAVSRFQRASGIKDDGKAGKATQVQLFSDSAKKVTGANDALATLRQGDTGERVKALQTLLQTYGYFTNDIDGQYGNATVTAIQQFQARNGLTVDGVAGPATNQMLYQGNPVYAMIEQEQMEMVATTNYTMLKQGMSGPDVLMMQEYLRSAGYYAGEQDGKFDSETLIALQAFQAQYDLKADGIAGQETLALLYSIDGYSEEAYVNQLPVVAAASTGPRAIMKQGDEGQDVMDLQERLEILGYLTKEPSGYFDAATKEAVRTFQQRNQLKVDGEAGKATVTAMYALGVTRAVGRSTYDEEVGAVSNRVRELEEQKAGGAIQASLSGGGVSASYQTTLYYTGGKNGTLYMSSSSGTEKQIFESPASFIHASDKGVTFVSGSKILRLPLGGGKVETLAQVGGISKLSMIGETMYYQEGGSLVKNPLKGDPVVLANGINDFSIDVYESTAYTASEQGVMRVALNGTGETMLVSERADQVQLCDSVIYFRSGGNLYRIENGIGILLMEADATWMGIYRDKIYFITGDRLYTCDTLGNNGEIFYDEQTADVSFVSGKVYITATHGGPVVKIITVE